MQIKINKNDFYRVLLSEVLPYEVPVIINGFGFYDKSTRCISKSIFKDVEETYPFVYRIIKNSDSYRSLHFIHPASQLKLVDFYRGNEGRLLWYCSYGDISLRFPTKVALSVKVSKNRAKSRGGYRDENILVESSEECLEPVFSSSYFKYKKYPFLYKFYDSYDFHRLEKKYKFLMQFDIAKCFDSIDVGKFGSVIKDELYQKRNKEGKAFEDYFSGLMKSVNFGRTGGIVIGPEFSRIFAEILLQSIERRAIEKIVARGMFHEVHFSIRRYVDDYFLFFSDVKVRDVVFSVFSECLECARLFVNEAKKIEYKIPFISGASMAKNSMQDVFSKIIPDLQGNKTYANDGCHIDFSGVNSKFIKSKKWRTLSNIVIKDLKVIVTQCGVDFKDISGYFFSGIRRRLAVLDRAEIVGDQEAEDAFCEYITFVLDIIFYVYSQDRRVRSTYLLSQLIVILKNIAQKIGPVCFDIAAKKIDDEIRLAIKSLSGDCISSGVEWLNLLLVHGYLEKDNKFNGEDLFSLLEKFTDSGVKINYFYVISFLFYMKNDVGYESVKERILLFAINFVRKNDININTESALIFLDLMACPYLEKDFKINLFRAAMNADYTDALGKDIFENLIAGNWYVDWSEN